MPTKKYDGDSERRNDGGRGEVTPSTSAFKNVSTTLDGTMNEPDSSVPSSTMEGFDVGTGNDVFIPGGRSCLQNFIGVAVRAETFRDFPGREPLYCVLKNLFGATGRIFL